MSFYINEYTPCNNFGYPQTNKHLAILYVNIVHKLNNF